MRRMQKTKSTIHPRSLHPTLYISFAEMYSPPISKFTFNQYLLTCDHGMWIRWAFERLDRKMPRRPGLKAYLDARRYLEKQGNRSSNKVNIPRQSRGL